MTLARIAVLAACLPAVIAQQPTTELGTIAWGRDLDAGLALAKVRRQPVLLLFQEVPG